MKLENQVVSLELAKKLKELGVKQEGLFEYRLFELGGEMVWSKPIIVGEIPDKLGGADVGFGKMSAFTVAELGEMLPSFILYDGYSNILKIERHSCWLFSYGKSILYSAGTGVTEADARAKMLVYLLENRLM